MSQSADILRHLERGRTITHLEAERRFGCCRLAARIDELRKAGHPIETRRIVQGGKQFAKYALSGKV